MSTQTHNNFTKTVTIITGFLILISIIMNNNQQPNHIVQAKEPTALELLEQAKKSKDDALKKAEEEDKKIQAYNLLNQVSSSSESLKVQR